MNDCATKRRISPEREAGRARFRQMLHAYLTEEAARGNPLVKHFAHALSVRRQYVERQTNVLDDGAQLACGDLNALPAAERVAILRRWLEQAEADLTPPKPARSAERLLMSLARRLGQISHTIIECMSPTSEAGEDMTAGEWDRVARDFAAAKRDAHDGEQRAHAAAELLRREER